MEAQGPDAESVETVQKVYVKDLREKQSLHTVFKVTKKARQTGRSGKPFIVLSLGDRTGQVDGRIFDNVDALDPLFLEGDYVLLKGNVITWQKRPQIVIEALERLDPEPIDPAEFAVPVTPEPKPQAQPKQASPAQDPGGGRTASQSGTAAGGASEPREPREPKQDGRRVVAQIREIVERVGDHHVKTLLLSFLDDPSIAPGLPNAPAAKGIHHAYKGGLADHILSVMKLAHRIADHYPMVDRDLLVAGALLHDLCKVREIVPDRNGGFEYSDEGRLVGHLVMTAQMIREKAARIPGFPEKLEHHLSHIVLAHHGQLEWGSPKLPMTLEALLVHLIDTIDSRVTSWLELMERDPLDGSWTETSRLYERNLWKAAPPTSRGRSPLEGRPARRGKKRGQRDRDRENKGEGRGDQRERERDRDRPKSDVPSFKPLAALASAVPSGQGGEPSELASQAPGATAPDTQPPDAPRPSGE